MTEETKTKDFADFLRPQGASHVKTFEYKYDTRTLTVGYKDGSSYEYYNVPEAVFEGMESSDSLGKYMHHNIKGLFEFKKVV